MADVTMPQLGETVTEGTITKWNKAVGDQVAEDEILFEVSTDKVDSEVPSPVSGTLTEIKAEEGETVEVGAVIAVIGDASDAPADDSGEADDTGEAGDGEAANTGEAAETGEVDDADDTGEAGDVDGSTPEEHEAEADETPTDKPGNADTEGAEAIGLETTEPEKSEVEAKKEETGKDDAADRASDAKKAPAEGKKASADGGKAPAPSDVPPADHKPVLMSPVVRRLVSEHNLDVDKIKGSGIGGRITRTDVLEAAQAGKGSAASPSDDASKDAPADKAEPADKAKPDDAKKDDGKQAKAAAPKGDAKAKPAAGGAQARPAAPPAQAGEGDEVIPFSRIRKVTATHMVMSKGTSAHTTTAIEVDFHGVEKVRLANKDKFKQENGASLTYLPFIARAVVDAIREFPHVNSSVGDDELIVRKNIDLGIAVDLNFNGLLVPVIRQADNLRLKAIATSVADMASRARNKRISPDELAGGTFTITNPGPFGSLFTVAVINQPQTAILSTDGVKKKPVVITQDDGTDVIAIHPVGLLVLTWDHRAFDGAYAAAFNARLKEIIETRDWAAEL